MWVDTFVAVPVIGLQTVPTFNALFKYPERLQPMLDEAISRDHEIEVGNDLSRGFNFRTKRGFSYKVLVDNIIVEFAYRSKANRVPGRLPTPEAALVEKFSVLVDETVSQLVRVVSLLSASGPIKVNRFGLLAHILMEKSKAPPGIVDMIKQHVSIFPGEVIKAESTFLANIESTGTYRDRCHHTYAYDDVDRPDDLTVKLDWQRVFGTPLSLSSTADPLRQMKDAALAYFERVGQGGLKDA